MNLENDETRRNNPETFRDEEVEAIDKLLEETGTYKKKSPNKPTKPVKKPEMDEEETLILSEDLYELVEENEDVIIYKIPEQPQEKRRLDSDEAFQVDANSHNFSDDKTRNIDVDILDDEPSEAIPIDSIENPQPTEFGLQENVEDEDSSIMNDSQIELERLELMIQEGELQNNVIHSDDSQELQDVSDINHPDSTAFDTTDLKDMIEESLDQFLLQHTEDDEEETHAPVEEELDFEPVESKTNMFKTKEIIGSETKNVDLSELETVPLEDIDLLEDAPYFIQEKTSVQKSASVISDIKKFKEEKGIKNSHETSKRHLEEESQFIKHGSEELNTEIIADDEDFEDPFAFVGQEDLGEEELVEEDEDTQVDESLPEQPMQETLNELEVESITDNQAESEVIPDEEEVTKIQIVEKQVKINEASDDKLLLRDTVKSEPENLLTDAASKIIADLPHKKNIFQRDIDLEEYDAQTTEAFLLSEVRKNDSEIIERLYEADDFGILRFDEDEDFKLTEPEIQKEMQLRFGHVKGTRAERMIVQYTLMKQKFKKLQVAHKRVLDAMKKAKQYQQQMMPTTPTDLPNLEFGALYKPAEQVSGDFYDFIDLSEDRWGVAIGDSAGHGIAPALIMTVTKKLLSVFIREGASIAEAMKKTNYYVTQNIPTATFITAVAGMVDLEEAKFTFVRAGHPAVILYNPKKRGLEPIAHSPSGMALGMDSGRLFNSSLEEESINLIPGDLIVMFTDGVFEISDMNRKRFGMKRFMNLIKDFGSGTVSFLMRKINNSLQEFRAGSTQDDDLTVICLKYLSHESPETRLKKA